MPNIPLKKRFKKKTCITTFNSERCYSINICIWNSIFLHYIACILCIVYKFSTCNTQITYTFCKMFPTETFFQLLQSDECTGISTTQSFFLTHLINSGELLRHRLMMMKCEQVCRRGLQTNYKAEMQKQFLCYLISKDLTNSGFACRYY